MENSTPQRSWFALTVKPRHEKAVEHALRSKELQPFLPLYRERRRWSDRAVMTELPLFPGYVFCRFEHADRLVVRTTAGVTGILGIANRLTPVPDSEIEALRSIAACGAPVRPRPYLEPGQAVRLTAGPLAGITGTLLRENGAAWVVVNVELLSRSVAVRVDRESLEPARPGCRGRENGSVEVRI